MPRILEIFVPKTVVCEQEGAGPTGPQGPAGAAGATGSPGSQILTGSGAPSNGTGVNGDFYLQQSSGDYFKKIAGVWVNEGNLQGPQGVAGSQGPQGVPGAAGGALSGVTYPLLYDFETNTLSLDTSGVTDGSTF